MTQFISRRARLWYLLISSTVLVLDQLTKLMAVEHLAGKPPRVVIPGFFNLIYSENPGGLFGYMGDLPDPWRGLLLTVVPTIAVGLIVLFMLRTEEMDRPTLLGLSLILGGALGNLVDRVTRGEVVDFLDAYISSPRLADWLVARFGTAHWPTFNVADSCIVMGAGLLMLTLFRPNRKPVAPDTGSTAGQPEPM